MKRIFLIDCPGVVYPVGDSETDTVLKGVVSIFESLTIFFYICQWLSFVIRKSHTGGGSLLSEQSAHVARLTVIDAYFKQINKRILALRQK